MLKIVRINKWLLIKKVITKKEQKGKSIGRTKINKIQKKGKGRLWKELRLIVYSLRRHIGINEEEN